MTTIDPNNPPPWHRVLGVAPLADAVTSVVPDPYTAQRHAMRSDGTVARRGRAHVVGALEWSRDADDDPTTTAPRRALSEYLHRLGHRNIPHQVDAITLTRCADAILGQSDAGRPLHMLLGTDAVSWEQVIHAGDGTTDDYGVAWHNAPDPYAAAVAYGVAFDGPAMSAQVPYMTRARRLITCDENGAPVAVYRPHTDTLRDVLGTLRRPSVVRPHVRKRKPRERLPIGRPRASDPAPSVTLTSWATVRTELLAPAADVDHVWHGHNLVTRPRKVRNGARASKRAAVKRAAVQTFPTADDLAAAVFAAEPGTRVRWAVGNVTGTASRSDRGLISARIVRPDGATRTRSNLRTPANLAAAVRNAAV